MSHIVWSIFSLLLAYGPKPVPQDVIGAPAPALQSSLWVRGNSLTKPEKGKVYVLDFWATWCGPCIEAMPHLASLEKTYPEVTFIAWNVWEPAPKSVPAFVEKMGPKMVGHVATDIVPDTAATDDGERIVWANKNGAMSKAWLGTAGVFQIPATFVVDKDGEIAWIGIPTDLDDVLPKVLNGSWDKAAFKKEYAILAEDAAALSKINTDLREFRAKKDNDGAIKAIDTYVRVRPSTRADFLGSEFQTLVKLKRFDDARAVGEYALSVTESDKHTALPQIAWVTAFMSGDPSPFDADFGLQIALRADGMANGHRPGAKEALAHFYFVKKEFQKAVDEQKFAIELIKGDKTEAEGRLAEYEKALKGG